MSPSQASVAMFTQLQGRGGFEHETHSELRASQKGGFDRRGP